MTVEITQRWKKEEKKMLEKKREKCHDTTEGKREREKKIFLMKCRY